ncbi:unnamed protein product [Cochlearia groenlandica]
MDSSSSDDASASMDSTEIEKENTEKVHVAISLLSFVSNPSSENQTHFGNLNAPCLVINKEEDVVMQQNTVDFKASKNVPKENFKSKNLYSERKRRDRINQRFYALRAVVPRVTKMSKNGTLSDAIDYINDLLAEKQKLEDELRGINDIECRDIAAEKESTIANPQVAKVSSKVNNKVSNIEPHDHMIHRPNLYKNQTQSLWFLLQVNLEVYQIGERDFLIRATQEYERDGFKRLIEAVDSCGLEIIDVNFNRLDLNVMTVLNVKANKDGFSPENLRDLLLKMINADCLKTEYKT